MVQRMNNDAAKKGFNIHIKDSSQESTDPMKGQDVGTTEAEAGAQTSASGNDGVESAAAGKATGAASADSSGAAEPDIIEEAEAVIEDAAGKVADAAETTGKGAVDTLEQARKEAADWQDRYMRLHAEWDTYRRRTNEQREEEKTRATEKLIENLLPVLDDFQRTVEYAEKNGEAGLLDGVKAVENKLVDALTKGGLQVIDPAGQPYNALEEQAVGTVPDPKEYDETVKEVYQKGYKLGKKVLRPAMVTVTTGGPKRPKPEEEQ